MTENNVYFIYMQIVWLIFKHFIYRAVQNHPRNVGRCITVQGKLQFVTTGSSVDCTTDLYMDKSIQFDLVSQFAFHYCFESLAQAEWRTSPRILRRVMHAGAFLTTEHQQRAGGRHHGAAGLRCQGHQHGQWSGQVQGRDWLRRKRIGKIISGKVGKVNFIIFQNNILYFVIDLFIWYLFHRNNPYIPSYC